jgi:secondary thiamine-phosphate synthase enzyme
MADVLRVSTERLKEVVDLTERIQSLIRRAKMRDGLCALFITHTTAALTTGEIGEGTEQDLLEVVEQIIPSIRFRHAHDRRMPGAYGASILGPSLTVPWRTDNGLGHLAIGAVGRIDGPRERTVRVTLFPT